MKVYGQLGVLPDKNLNNLYNVEHSGVYSMNYDNSIIGLPDISSLWSEAIPQSQANAERSGYIIIKNTPYMSIQEYYIFKQQFKRIGEYINKKMTFKPWMSRTTLGSGIGNLNDLNFDTSIQKDVIYTSRQDVEEQIKTYIRNNKGNRTLPFENGPQSIYDPEVTGVKNAIKNKIDNVDKYKLIPINELVEYDDYLNKKIKGTTDHTYNEFFYGDKLKNGEIYTKGGDIVISNYNYKPTHRSNNDMDMSARGIYFSETMDDNNRIPLITINHLHDTRNAIARHGDTTSNSIDTPLFLAYGHLSRVNTLIVRSRLRAEVIGRNINNNNVDTTGNYNTINGNNASGLLTVHDLTWKVMYDRNLHRGRLPSNEKGTLNANGLPVNLPNVTEFLVSTSSMGWVTFYESGGFGTQQSNTRFIKGVPGTYIGHEFNPEFPIQMNTPSSPVHRVEDVMYYNGNDQFTNLGDFGNDTFTKWIIWR